MSINKDSQKAPNLRFKGFTDEWEQRKLGEVSDIVRGASPRPIQDEKWFDNNSEIGWLRISDVTEQDGRIHHLEQKISKLGQEKTRVLHSQHLLLSIAATVGKPVINYVSTGVHDGFLIFLNPKFNIEFMFQWFENFRSNWKKYGQPGSQVNLNSELVKSQEVHFPSNFEQNKISNFFLTIDKTITLHQRKLDQLKQLKESLLQQMFPDKGETVPKLRFAGFEGDWEERKLGEISKIKTGSSDLQDADATGNYPFFVRSENIERSNRFLFEGEAILIPGEGRLGEIYHYINGKFDYHQRVYKISNFSDYNVQGLFVLFYLKKNFKQHALKYTVKATVDSLRLPTLLEFNIMVPNNEEQQHISNLLNGLEKLIQANENRIDDLKSLKTVLLQNMFI